MRTAAPILARKASCFPPFTKLVRAFFVLASKVGTGESSLARKKNNDDRRDAKYHDEAYRFVRRCQEAGIMVHGCFMVGNLNETSASMEKTLSFAKKLQPDTAQFFPIMVYPGTSAYEEAKKRDYIQIEDWGAWLTKDGLHNSVVNLPGITHDQLVSFCDRARRSFYLNPSYLVYKVKQSLRDRRELQRNIKG